MKRTHFLITMCVLPVILAACQTAPSPTMSATQGALATSAPEEVPTQVLVASPATNQETMPKPSPTVGDAYPPPSEAYPSPLGGIPAYNPYPGPSDGAVEYFDWSQVETIILKGEIEEVYQAHSLHVTLVLPDGRIVLAIEPQIDEVFRLLDRCGDPCKDVIQVTE